MTSFFEFLSANELTIVVCLMVVIFLLIMTIIIVDITSRNKSNDKDDEKEKISNGEDLEKTNIKIDTNGMGMIANSEAIKNFDMDAVTKNLEKTQEIEEIKYVEEDEELEKTKALLELETLKKELAKLEEEKEMKEKELSVVKEEPKEEVKEVNTVEENKEEVLKEISVTENVTDTVEVTEEKETPTIQNIESDIKKELEQKINTYEDEVNTFESLQEENAIISVEELTKASQNITDEEIEQYEDDGNEPISLKELEQLYKGELNQEEVPTLKEVKEEVKPVQLMDFGVNVKPASEVYDDKEFKNTPVISPIYGLKQTEASIALEQTANLDKLNEEIKKTNEFLLALKELRKNLD